MAIGFSTNFEAWLADAVRRIGAHSAACVRMDHPALRRAVEENTAMVADWLAAGKQGGMAYLERMSAAKANPWSAFPFAKSVLVFTFTNHWGDPAAGHPFPPVAADALLGYVSAYAREMDYHTTGRAMLAELHQWLGSDIRAEGSVDTGAVYERLFASVGGLGGRGGNGLLRVPESAGVRVFIGCLFVEAELPEVIPDPQLPFSCSDCRACVRACPTGAIQFGEPMDARRCISYLTIEKKGVLNRQEREWIGDWLFGCDGCTMACPPRGTPDLRIPVDLEWLLKSPAEEIRRAIKGTAVSYAGVTQLRRNAVAILANKKSERAQELLAWVAQKTGSELIQNQLTACQGEDE